LSSHHFHVWLEFLKKKVQCSSNGYFTVNFPSTYMVLMSIFTPTFEFCHVFLYIVSMLP
jgi:hypothetical protein